MHGKFLGQNKNVLIDLRYSDRLCPFRLSFIGKKSVIAATYSMAQRTDESTPFYIFEERDIRGLYEGFRSYYTPIRDNAKHEPTAKRV